MNKMTLAFLAGASALAVAATAYANYRDTKGAKEGAGWETMMESHFTEMDANKDGNVSHDEFIAFQAKQNEQRWAKFSAEAGDDGVVSLEEAKLHHASMMQGGMGMMGEGMGPNCDGTGPHGKMRQMMQDADPEQQ